MRVCVFGVNAHARVKTQLPDAASSGVKPP